MPELQMNGKTKHFLYTKSGYKAYKKAKKKLSGKSYTKEHIDMARKMIK